MSHCRTCQLQQLTGEYDEHICPDTVYVRNSEIRPIRPPVPEPYVPQGVCVRKSDWDELVQQNKAMKEALGFISNSLMCAQGPGEDVRDSQLHEIASAMDDLQIKHGPIWRWQ